MKQTLSDGGYYVNQVLVNAAEFGVPQNRRRAFFLITRRNIDDRNLVYEFGKRKRASSSVASVLRDLPVPEPRPDRYIDVEDIGPIPNHYAMQHSDAVKKKIASIPPGTGPMSYRKLHPEYPSNTLISGNRAPPAHYSQPRSITVREAMRLQGFPDDFRVYGPFGNQMRQVTNAVPPPLAQVALEVLCDVVGIEVG
jgi:DNA (cytosine-5)-methyltransferase 1